MVYESLGVSMGIVLVFIKGIRVFNQQMLYSQAFLFGNMLSYSR